MTSLVVYYSRTEKTKGIAEKIREKLDCAIEEIIDEDPRKGSLGFIKSGFQSIMKSEADIKHMLKDPEDYDIIIIGTPVWASKPSNPVRTYINNNKDKFNNVAFFTTANSDSEDVVKILSELTGKDPIATLNINKSNIDSCDDELECFVNKLR